MSLWFNQAKRGSFVSETRKHYWSPDCGYFVHFGPNLYHESGWIGDAATDWPARIGLNQNTKCPEDYSLWSDERRAQEMAERQRRREEWEQTKREYDARRWKVVLAARRKLTRFEFESIIETAKEAA